MVLSNEARKLMRTIIKQVHPDLFPNNPYERQANTESLKALNTYVDELTSDQRPRPARTEFFIKDGVGNLKSVTAQLSSSGSLAPLFYAFGLIDGEQLLQDENNGSTDVQDTNFLHWLREQVQDAVRTAEQHEILKLHIRKLRTSLEERYSLAGMQVGAEYAASILEQERQVEALEVMEQALQPLTEQGLDFEGVSIQLYHPALCPKESNSYVDDKGMFAMRTQFMRAYVADNGCVHVVADPESVLEQLAALDLDRARTLTQAAYFWVRRARELTPPVTQLLGVRSVWCDTKTEQNSQKFVIWAGYLLEGREEIKAALSGRKFSFSIIVHTDPQAPLINFHQSSPILNVSADCPPDHLMEFLVSEAGGSASDAATEVHASRAREEALLESVRKALEAKCVIKICMNDQVIQGAQRLLDNAEMIRNTVDLRGACIALDDCYEVWDSGFISIPYNFSIKDLPDMVRMLKAGQRPGSPMEEASVQQGSSGTARAVAVRSRSSSTAGLCGGAGSSARSSLDSAGPACRQFPLRAGFKPVPLRTERVVVSRRESRKLSVVQPRAMAVVGVVATRRAAVGFTPRMCF